MGHALPTQGFSYSFEFFPPKTDKGLTNLENAASCLAKIKPEYFSVTYGAGGSTQKRTIETITQIKSKTNINTAPHISCISSTREELAELIHFYKKEGITHLVALRGDLPSGVGSTLGELDYASDLVRFIREETGDYFYIEVAAYPEFHPQTSNAQLGLQRFKEKIQAGANSAITQYFYNADAYFQFLNSCERLGITVPIVPGIMPITNFHQLARFSNLCGAEIPRWLKMRLESYQDDPESIQKLGEEVVTRLCERLLKGGAPGLHFYTLNKIEPSLAILSNLGLITQSTAQAEAAMELSS